MSDIPQFIDLDDEDEPLPQEAQQMVEELREPQVDVVDLPRPPVPQEELLEVLRAQNIDATAKLVELTQMCLELNGAVQGLIQQVNANHKTLHKLEGRIQQLENRSETNQRGGPLPVLPPVVAAEPRKSDEKLRAARSIEAMPEIVDEGSFVPPEPQLSPQQRQAGNAWDSAYKEDQ